MTLSDNAVQEFKDLMKKEHGVELTDSEAGEQSESLLQFAKILIESAQIELSRKKRLEKEPEGFHLDESDGVYNCLVCYKQVSGKQTWWDQWGVKCLDCQRNIKEGVIPPEICKNDDLIIKRWQFKNDFGLHPAAVQKLRREERLIGRDLRTEDGAVYYTAYLVKENKKFLKEFKKARNP